MGRPKWFEGPLNASDYTLERLQYALDHAPNYAVRAEFDVSDVAAALKTIRSLSKRLSALEQENDGHYAKYLEACYRLEKERRAWNAKQED